MARDAVDRIHVEGARPRVLGADGARGDGDIGCRLALQGWRTRLRWRPWRRWRWWWCGRLFLENHVPLVASALARLRRLTIALLDVDKACLRLLATAVLDDIKFARAIVVAPC